MVDFCYDRQTFPHHIADRLVFCIVYAPLNQELREDIASPALNVRNELLAELEEGPDYGGQWLV